MSALDHRETAIVIDPTIRDLLTCWKEIADYFGKGVRTVQRWEHIGMPIHRPSGDRRIVFADPAELKAWALQAQPPKLYEAAERPQN